MPPPEPLAGTQIGPIVVAAPPDSVLSRTPAPQDPLAHTLPQTDPPPDPDPAPTERVVRRAFPVVPGPLPAAPLPDIPGYRIEAELGRGGMGVVFRATHTGLHRPVAIKMVLHGQYAAADSVRRFRAEAEAIARLKHPNVVQVYDLGQTGGQPFFVLEFVDGGGLDRRLKDGPLPPAEAAELVAKLADGVHAAHSAGIVHRDLKPANVLLTADGTPKVADFGLAKDLGDGGQTQTGAVMGTPMYMAPEQAAGRVREIGPRTDVYALGAILYECLTGGPPFKGDSVLSTLDMVRSVQPRSLRAVRKAVPAGLEAVCLRCLEKNPADRYESAAALAADLRRAAAGERVRAVRRPSRQRRWVAVAAGLAVIGWICAEVVVKPPLRPVLPPAAPAAAPETGGVHALLAAVADYDIQGVHSTWKYAERDVTDTARMLEDRWGVPKANVRVLTKSAAAADPTDAPTGGTIRRELGRLRERAGADATVLVFLSGTGYQLTHDPNGPLGPRAMHPAAFHFLPLGGDPNRPETALPYPELMADLAAVPAKTKLVLIDACRKPQPPGPGPGWRPPPPGGPRPPVPQPPPDDGRTGVFFSCRAGEESREDGFIRHGVFARGVLNALDPTIGAAADDGKVTVGELVQFAEAEVASAVERLRLPPQRPELVGRLPADVVLLAKPER